MIQHRHAVGGTTTTPTAAGYTGLQGEIIVDEDLSGNTYSLRVQDGSTAGGVIIPRAPVVDGQLIIGKTSGGTYTRATLTQGSGVTITNGSGAITIAATGLSTALTDAHILVGNSSNIATDVAMSGDITITNAGVTAIGANKVTTAKILDNNVTLAKLATQADLTILANISGGAAVPTAATFTAIVDACLSASTNGQILQRVAGAWDNVGLSAAIDTAFGGSNGEILQRVAGAWDNVTLSAAIDTAFGGADGDYLVRASGSWDNQRPHYNFAFAWITGAVLPNSQVIGYHHVAKGITFPANFGAYLGHSSYAGGTANATASTVFTVAKADTMTSSWTTIGTITIGAGGITATFATSGGTTQAATAGQVIRVIAPASADATFADPAVTFAAYET